VNGSATTDDAMEQVVSTRDAQDVLRDRAAELRTVFDEERERDVAEVLVFLLGGCRYAVETSFVNEGRLCENRTAMPCTPNFIAGVMNVHGEILSVNDLRSHLGVSGGDTLAPRCAVVLAGDEMVLGVGVNKILGVDRIERDTVHPFVPAPGDNASDYIAGILPDGTVFLDGQKILADRALVVDDET